MVYIYDLVNSFILLYKQATFFNSTHICLIWSYDLSLCSEVKVHWFIFAAKYVWTIAWREREPIKSFILPAEPSPISSHFGLANSSIGFKDEPMVFILYGN